jgi:hypothetical protein
MRNIFFCGFRHSSPPSPDTESIVLKCWIQISRVPYLIYVQILVWYRVLSFILGSGIRNYGPRYPGLQREKEKSSKLFWVGA